jgi:hypothetical protein
MDSTSLLAALKSRRQPFRYTELRRTFSDVPVRGVVRVLGRRVRDVKSHRVMVSEYRSKSLTERHKHTMAMDHGALLDLLAQPKPSDVTDRIRVATETQYLELIDAEATTFIGAAPFGRTDERITHRNGTRERTLTTAAGELKALGADTGISKSEGSRICAGLDAEVAQLRDLSLSTLDYPYVPRRDILQSPRQPPNRLPGHGRLDHPHRLRQPDRDHIEKQFTEVTTMLARSHPKVAALLDDARPDLLAFAGFPHDTGGRSGRRTRWNGSTRRSNAAPTSSVSSPTRPHYSGSRRSPGRAARRMASRRPPLLLRIVDARTEDHERANRAHRGGGHPARTHYRLSFNH